ncbi:odorant receptor 94b-like, partial [Sitodiplosis mosellana]|uniref:odorant receptor 94b-like n=1 Tax=Sitodiplosis mosellana TaxID=263140 RepID=UPI0024441ED4
FTLSLSALFKVILFAFFSTAIIFTCCGLLYLRYLLKIGDVVTFVHQIFWSGAGLTWFFIFCDIGNGVTARYEDVSDALYDTSITLLNLGLAKQLPLIMNNAQSPVKMRALMNVECTRETFKKLCNGSYSYFTILSQFNR